MYVKNTGSKVIGFGSIFIVPGESGELPGEFDKDHPTIKFYIEKGWLTEINEPEEGAVNVNEDAEKAHDPSNEQGSRKSLSQMNLTELRAEATTLGIEFEETDTKAVLLQKIRENNQAE